MKCQFVVSLIALVICSLTAVAQAGSIVLVRSYGNGSILEYDATTGAFIKTFVSSGYGGLYAPDGILIGPDGNVYVANSDSGAAAVLRYDMLTGAFITAFIPLGSGGLGPPQ